MNTKPNTASAGEQEAVTQEMREWFEGRPCTGHSDGYRYRICNCGEKVPRWGEGSDALIIAHYPHRQEAAIAAPAQSVQDAIGCLKCFGTGQDIVNGEFVPCFTCAPAPVKGSETVEVNRERLLSLLEEALTARGAFHRAADIDRKTIYELATECGVSLEWDSERDGYRAVANSQAPETPSRAPYVKPPSCTDQHQCAVCDDVIPVESSARFLEGEKYQSDKGDVIRVTKIEQYVFFDLLDEDGRVAENFNCFADRLAQSYKPHTAISEITEDGK